jgi:xanthine dehydrogenase YagS FAD-binding subunit
MTNYRIAEPKTIGQVTSLLSEKKGEVFLMAGGTDLYTEIKDEIVRPDIVVDLRSIPDLAYIKEEKDGVRIGAMTRVARLVEDNMIVQAYPGLHEAANSLATPQIRNMGTVGGNLCQRPRCWYYRDPQRVCAKKGGATCFAYAGRNKYHAILGGSVCFIVYPSDLAPMLIAMDAEITIASPDGERTLPLETFYVLPDKNVRRENVLKSDEILTEIRVPPVKSGEKSTYLKLKERATWDFALVSVAVCGTFSGKVCRDIKIVLGGVAPIPWRFKKAEKLIQGKEMTENLVRQAAREGLKEARPLKENAYKLDLVETAVYRAVLSLLA